MALKKKIDKAAFDKLPEHFKTEYKLQGEDYVLDVDGDDEAEALRRARDNEKGETAKEKQKRAAAEAALAEAQAKVDELSGKAASADTKSVELKNAEKRLAALEQATAADLKHIQSLERKRLVDDTAQTLAAKLAGKNAAVLLPHIKERLDVNFGEGGTSRVGELLIKGKDGKANDKLTVEGLHEEFVADKTFSGILVASKAAGGSAPRSQQPTPPPGSAGPQGQSPPQQLINMKPTDLRAIIDAKVAERQAAG